MAVYYAFPAGVVLGLMWADSLPELNQFAKEKLGLKLVDMTEGEPQVAIAISRAGAERAAAGGAVASDFRSFASVMEAQATDAAAMIEWRELGARLHEHQRGKLH